MKLQTKVKVYGGGLFHANGQRQFQADARRLARGGWHVVSTVPGQSRWQVIVTYQRESEDRSAQRTENALGTASGLLDRFAQWAEKQKVEAQRDRKARVTAHLARQAPPQYSADGQWWWNGREWVPVPPQ